MTEKEQILEQIRAAFPPTPIDARGAFGPRGTGYPDAAEYMERLDGKSWDQLDREYFVRRSDALGFLDMRHFVAVLPVYLRAMLDDGGWSPATGMLMLTLPKRSWSNPDGLGKNRFRALQEALTDPQRSAIASVLQAFAEMYPDDDSVAYVARVALEDFWKDHLPAGD